jgi:Ca-activated chloride channel family protein
VGAGTYAYAEDARDLVTILEQEGQFTLLPIATDFEVVVTPAAGYNVGRIYGARRATRVGQGVVLSSPALFLGARTGAQDTTLGRRGGGGGLFVELIAEPDSGISAGAAAFSAVARYVEVDTGENVELVTSAANPLAPGENPADNWPVFSDSEPGKPFMMLNMYLALRGIVAFYSQGDCARAVGLSDMMSPVVEGWQGQYQDPDIDADGALMHELALNIEIDCQYEAIPVPDFDGGCFGL